MFYTKSITTPMEESQRKVDEAWERFEKREMANGLAGRPLQTRRYYNPDGRPLSADWKSKGFPPPEIPHTPYTGPFIEDPYEKYYDRIKIP